MTPQAQIGAIRGHVDHTLDAIATLDLPDRCHIILGAQASSGGHVSLFPTGPREFDDLARQLGDGFPSQHGNYVVYWRDGGEVHLFVPAGAEVPA